MQHYALLCFLLTTLIKIGMCEETSANSKYEMYENLESEASLDPLFGAKNALK